MEELFGEGAGSQEEEPDRCGSCGGEAELWGENDYDAQGNEIEGSANLACPKCGEDVEAQVVGIWD